MIIVLRHIFGGKSSRITEQIQNFRWAESQKKSTERLCFYMPSHCSSSHTDTALSHVLYLYCFSRSFCHITVLRSSAAVKDKQVLANTETERTRSNFQKLAWKYTTQNVQQIFRSHTNWGLFSCRVFVHMLCVETSQEKAAFKPTRTSFLSPMSQTWWASNQLSHCVSCHSDIAHKYAAPNSVLCFQRTCKLIAESQTQLFSCLKIKRCAEFTC